MNVPSIETMKELQAELGLKDTHVIYTDDNEFVIAHTDKERKYAAEMREELACICDLHKWLGEQPVSPLPRGYYVARPHEPDLYSESLGHDQWDFEPIITHGHPHVMS